MIGRVVSAKMKHTATVLIESTKRHPLYKKTFARTKRYLVDDSKGVSEGDIVEIVKVKPISKRKHWQITKVIGKDIIAIGTEHLAQVAEKAIEEVMPEETEEIKTVNEKPLEEKPAPEVKTKLKKRKETKKKLINKLD